MDLRIAPIANKKAVFRLSSDNSVPDDDLMFEIYRREGKMSIAGFDVGRGGACFLECLNNVFKSADCLIPHF